MLITNDCLAVKPLNNTPVPETNSMFSAWKNKSPLVEFEILYGDMDGKYLSGGKVFIKPYIDIPPYLKETYTFNNIEFILLPKHVIVGYESPSEYV